MNLTGKTVCITGIGGFIGRRSAQIAKERGMNVRGIEMNVAKAEELKREGFTVIVGNTSDPEILKEAVKGADFILHTAAVVREGGSLEEFRKVNVFASVELAKIAKESGARGMIHLSSVMVYGFSYPNYVDEQGPFRGEGNPYCITKIEGESELVRLNDPDRFGILIVRPGDVYGPGSIPWVVRPVQLMKKKLFSLPDGGKGTINLTYVDNLVAGTLLALEKEAWGQSFNITDDHPMTWKEYFFRLADAAEISRPPSLPAWLLKTFVVLMEYGFGVFGKRPPATREGVNFLLRQNPVSIEKAKSVLGYKPVVDTEKALQFTFDWVKTQVKSL
ncbi:NAD-dependent epimerase/dehydratase family protein [Leptospira gomenensis]|uniref:NAD-dependent epimerase/dehydratase family protein n=1 Tax=Leptospira gomenensis TaxID=2484974 RepID=A0A5F1YDQ6_9LEPT|nr:NAD-dependent epimerase/dehydratase family protein [Leptospira gomenensis]TGK35919.1 NAD-dependent epimerase/dehydratase family protein [Leptospira gomenensis]TGK40049.1 NAD-dependent epimerase/dehydratase family protein [Leptospira gomenensis]TGK51499.1 NAD-dependent epimerase/dehydratase family protein [Leptospira gomenensis]TGK68056.1 NAD-dependent epimerase/dehydratase family protein [Leptospira gomenensis]